MKIPFWFKLVWWVLLTAGAGVLFFTVSWPCLSVGDHSGQDLVLLGVWVLLLIMPLVGEFNILGMGYKRELEDLKQEMRSQFLSLRTEVQSSASVSSQIAPQFFLGPRAPTDQELERIEKQAGALLLKESRKRGAKAGPAAPEAVAPAVPAANQLLFAVRFELEDQLKRIARARGLTSERSLRWMGGTQVAAWLRDDGVLSEKFFSLLRDVYGICNMGVHAVEVTPKQADFVRRLAPGLIAELKRI